MSESTVAEAFYAKAIPAPPRHNSIRVMNTYKRDFLERMLVLSHVRYEYEYKVIKPPRTECVLLFAERACLILDK